MAQKRKPIEHYFDESKVMDLMCDLHNKRNSCYLQLKECLLESEKLPDQFMYADDYVVSEFIEILDAEDKVGVIWTAERYKKYKSKSWWRRALLWLAK